jgi:hypothetical protein
MQCTHVLIYKIVFQQCAIGSIGIRNARHLGLGEDLGEQLLVALHGVPGPGPQVRAEETEALAHLHRRQQEGASNSTITRRTRYRPPLSSKAEQRTSEKSRRSQFPTYTCKNQTDGQI